MAESIVIKGTGKEEKYCSLLPQLSALMDGETDMIANMANTAAALSGTFGFLWTGFYLVKGNELVLGPFQGPVACTRIAKGRGVCGTCWEQKKTLVVPDVDAFPGHIACSTASRSEIVIPLFNKDQVFAVLDIDSDQLNHFDAIDQKYLEQIAGLIKP